MQTQRVDLALLDMVIGNGMNGQQTYEKIIQIHPGQKALIISGCSENDTVKKALDQGTGRLLNKPYSKEQLELADSSEIANMHPENAGSASS